MKTKTIFKTMALAMLMPAMLLTASCNKNEDITKQEGYQIPVTVNVTREGDDATKATYTDNGNGTGSLGFSAGDKLLVRGNDNSDGGAGMFAGLLDYDAVSGKFSGTITTQNEYTGTPDELFTAANSNWVGAALFPNGYESYEFLSLSGSGYSTSYSMSYNKAIAATKAAAVEQFSLETANTYSSGFALSPQNAILNFTITGLTDGAKAVVLKNGSSNMFSGSVTPSSGTATFALGARISDSPVFFKNVILTIGGTDIAIASTNNYFEAGKIYNINRSASAPLPAVFTVDAGKTVKFSKSNLRYASGAWGFFAHQYDYYATYNADAWDKFGWSNSTNNFGMSTSTVNADYQGDLVDWGTVPGIGTGWFTLSNNEWGYLFNTRSASTVNSVADARYAKGKVNNVYGIILFPDTYTHPDGVTNPVGINQVGDAGWNGNNYNATDWGKMEAAGCVFLPATGYREGTSVSGSGSSCSYRSSSRNTSTTDMVYYVYFTSSSLTVSASNYGRYGQCVRLVRE